MRICYVDLENDIDNTEVTIAISGGNKGGGGVVEIGLLRKWVKSNFLSEAFAFLSRILYS